MTRMKEIWLDKYEDYINEGYDTVEAETKASEYCEDYLAQKADFERQKRKEEKFYD